MAMAIGLSYARHPLGDPQQPGRQPATTAAPTTGGVDHHCCNDYEDPFDKTRV